MGKLANVIALAGFVACSSNNNGNGVDASSGGHDAAHLVDAAGSGSGSGSGDFTCASNTTPPTVPTMVAVTGKAGTLSTDIASIIGMMFTQPYTGAVSLCSAEPCTGANLLGTATADATGAYSFDVATNSAPVPGYIEIAGAGSGSAATVETLSYVGTPFVKATTVPFTVVTPQAAIGLAQQAGGQCTTGAGLGFVAFKAVDCAGHVVTDSANVHGALTQNNAAVGDPPIDIYQTLVTGLASAGLSQYAAQAAPLQGIYLVCGVPVGQTKVQVTYNNVAFLPVTVLAVDGGATEVVAQPGY